MGLFLLGIPMALVGAKILHDDTQQTIRNLRIPKANLYLEEQYNQIDEYLIDIFEYVDAKGDIYYDGMVKKIKNTENGGYGALEYYLAQKGYRKEAIEYAKKQYDNINIRENINNNSERDKRIQIYENKLSQGGYYDTWKTSVYYYTPKIKVEQNVEKLLNYFHSHHQEQAYCSIVMDGYYPNENHCEIWTIKIPHKATRKEIEQYIDDIRNKILGEN